MKIDITSYCNAYLDIFKKIEEDSGFTLLANVRRMIDCIVRTIVLILYYAGWLL